MVADATVSGSRSAAWISGCIGAILDAFIPRVRGGGGTSFVAMIEMTAVVLVSATTKAAVATTGTCYHLT